MIFADHNSTTPVDPRVINYLNEITAEVYGNYSSRHCFGIEAEAVLGRALNNVAELVGCETDEIYFTSGATESNNWILSQTSDFYGPKIYRTSIEHPSILEPADELSNTTGIPVVDLPITMEGQIDINNVEHRSFVAFIGGHNEFHFITKYKDVAHELRQRECFVHCDGTQLIGKVPFNFRDAGFNTISLSSHKLYGPKGIGALVIRRKDILKISPFLRGGGQQHGLRSGTVPVPLIGAFGEACRFARQDMEKNCQHLKSLAKYLVRGLEKNGVGLRLIGPKNIDDRLPGCVAFLFDNIETGSLCEVAPHIGVSTSSACKSDAGNVQGLTAQEERHFLRVGFGLSNTESDADEIIRVLKRMDV